MMKRIESVDVTELAAESLKETSQPFLDLQKEQLFAGKKETQGKIRPFYRPATKAIKKRKGQPIDRVTLKDTGFFHNSLFFSVRPATGEFMVLSSDVKAKWLLSRYGETIVGIGGQYHNRYVATVRPVFLKKIKDKLQLD